MGGVEQVHSWVDQVDINDGACTGTSTVEPSRSRRSHRRSKPSDVLAAELDRPYQRWGVHRDEFGIEPICATLQVAPSMYHAARNRVPSARVNQDAAMMPILVTSWVTNRKLYGAHRLWKTHGIGRDQAARLMKALDIQGTPR